MSRSRKKHAICGMTTSRSEKKDKKFANQKERRKVKFILENVLKAENSLEEAETVIMPKKDEIIDIWSMAKDGKQYIDKKSKWYKKAIRK